MHLQQSQQHNVKRLVKRKKHVAKKQNVRKNVKPQKQNAKKNVLRLVTRNALTAKANVASAQKSARKIARLNAKRIAKQQKQSARKTAKRLVTKSNNFLNKQNSGPSWNYPTWSFSCFLHDIALSLQ